MPHLPPALLTPSAAYFDPDAQGFGGVAIDVVVVIAFGILAVWLGSPLVQAVFRRVDRPRAESGSRGHAGGSVRQVEEPILRPSIIAAGQILRGGTWIGGLERIAVYAGVITGWKEGVAVVLAIKGLARYPELKSTTSAAAERFIIGTFVSVLLAVACAGAAWVIAVVT